MKSAFGWLALALAVPRPCPASDDSWPSAADVPPGYVIVEGDLIVPLDYLARRATFGATFWPNGIVPYFFDPGVTTLNRDRMIVAMNGWEAVAGVYFIESAAHSDYLYIQNAGFNASEGVGPAGGLHDIWISDWDSPGVLLHELGHALAYWHEHTRADRDQFVRIESGNISQTACADPDGDPQPCDPQFATRPVGGEYLPYDFGSVMHYDACAFSCCDDDTDCSPGSACEDAACRTITTLDPDMQALIGQRDGLSSRDALVMRGHYPFDGDCFYDRDAILPGDGRTIRSPIWGLADFMDAWQATPVGGTLFILRSETYSVEGNVLDTPRTLYAPLGAVLDG